MTDTIKWTEDDQVRLAALMASGASGIAIAAELGRSINAIKGQAKKLGLKFARGQRGRTDLTQGPLSTSYSRLFGD